MNHGKKEKIPTQTKRQLYWIGILKDWEKSGLSSTKYCKQHRIGESVFYKWKALLGYKRLLKSGKKPGPDKLKQSGNKLTTFVNVDLLRNDAPINFGKEKSLPMEVEMLLKNGRHIKLCCQANRSEIAQLLTILEEMPC